VDLGPDIYPPHLLRTTPGEGTTGPAGLRTVRLEFSESLAATSLAAAIFRLLDEADDPIAAVNVQLKNDDRTIELEYPALATGPYRLVFAAAGITDRAGNPLGSADTVIHFNLDVSRLFTDPVFETGYRPEAIALGDLNADG